MWLVVEISAAVYPTRKSAMRDYDYSGSKTMVSIEASGAMHDTRVFDNVAEHPHLMID